eukprot:s4200_g4.t1
MFEGCNKLEVTFGIPHELFLSSVLPTKPTKIVLGQALQVYRTDWLSPFDAEAVKAKYLEEVREEIQAFNCRTCGYASLGESLMMVTSLQLRLQFLSHFPSWTCYPFTAS